MQPRMRACGKNPGDILMAIGASLVSHKGRTLDLQGRDDCPLSGTGTGEECQDAQPGAGQYGCVTPIFHVSPVHALRVPKIGVE
jgi:hypothetical protein